jgi:hypothetical protein
MKDGVAADLPAAALLAASRFPLVKSLVFGNPNEELPEIIAVMKLWETASVRGPKEGVKGLLDDIFFIPHAGWRAAQPLTRQTQQALKVSRPQFLRGDWIARLQPTNPLRY